MQLSILHIFVSTSTTSGIIKFYIQKEYHNLCICLETYKINTQVKETVEVFKNNLLSDPNNPNLVNIIPTKLVLKEAFQLTDCERIVENLSIAAQGNTQEFKVDFGKNLSCVITKDQVKRVYNFFSSFINNFAMIDSIYTIYINMLKLKDGDVPQVEEKQPDLAATKPLEIEYPKPIQEISTVVKDQTLIETILNTYTINNIIKSFIIHHIFNHLRFNSDNIKIDIESNSITINNLFSSFDTLNSDYILSVLNTIVVKDIENIISFNQKKILETIIMIFGKERRDSEDNLNLYLLFFIFYIYQYRFIVLKYPDFDMSNYFKIETQQSGINYFIKNLAPSKIITVSVVETDFNEINPVSDALVKEISDKFKHLIPISEESFLDLAVKEYNIQKDNISQIKDFNISNKKLLNIQSIINNNKAISKVIQQKSQTIITESYQDRTGLLNYEDKIITKTYLHFKEYISNPKNIVSAKEIPKSVISLFDFFFRNISKLFPDKTITDTYTYYKILHSNLPTPKAYSHQTYLYLIFNLIIPYYYDEYKVSEFTDIFI